MTPPSKKQTQKCRRNCCVDGCKSKAYTDRTVSFHLIPKDGDKIKIKNKFGKLEEFEKRELWADRLRLDPVERNLDHASVCSLHFRPDDFFIPTLYVSSKRRILKRIAIPSQNLPNSSEEEDEVEEEGEEEEGEEEEGEEEKVSDKKSPGQQNNNSVRDNKQEPVSAVVVQMSSPKTRAQRAQVHTTFIMECEEDDLSTTQLDVFEAAEKEYNEAMDKITEMLKSYKVIHKGKDVMVLQSGTLDAPTPQQALSIPPLVASANLAPKPTGTTLVPVRGAPGTSQVQRLGQTTYQLVVNSNLGNNVGYLVASSTAKTPVIQGSTTTAKTATPLQLSTVGGRPLTQTTLSGNTIKLTTNQPAGKIVIPSITAGEAQKRLSLPAIPRQVPNILQAAGSTVQLAPISQSNKIQPAPAPSVSSGASPSSGSNVPTVDLTEGDDDRADSREIVFNKLSGKTFPSLVVLARPSLRVKDIPSVTTTKERSTMDAKVKAVLIYTPTKFTEWLIQQGLVRSEQCCITHVSTDGKQLKLKLGMYSDASKFPYSGGYVWISECCPQRFISVFSGSLFEGAPHPPTILLKLIYHWACQTSVSNIVQWVKVDNFYIKNFFTLLRALCTAAIHTKMGLLGGLGKFVEVGVISLGTTSQDGQQRQVKVEVLGVLDKDSKMVRLRAIEPMQDGDRNLKRRFAKILEPLAHWVHPGSYILTDFSIDKSTLNLIGFNSVYQANANEGILIGNKRCSNQNVMEYLRKIVPRMFLNTLSLLNRSLIQQFLDELTWRECYGPHPPNAFDNIIQHIAEQTKVEFGEPLIKRLNSIAANPFKNWNYQESQIRLRIPTNYMTQQLQQQTSNDFSMDVSPQSLCEVQYAPGPASSKRPKAQRQPQPVVPDAQAATSSAQQQMQTAVKRIKLNTSDQTYLDSYYYANMAGNQESILQDMDSNFNVKCVVCPMSFNDNISLMKHVFSHVIYEQSEINSKRFLFCPYCLKRMQTSMQLATHKADCHQNSTAVMACCICQTRFPMRQALIKHMHMRHSASEMPYRCGVCNMRSSFHQSIVDHFYDAHTGGSSLQCPICLKIFYACGIRSRGNYVNLTGFYQHLVGHKRHSNRRKCERCALVFQQSKHVQEHEEADHKSMRNVPRVAPVVSTEANPTIIIPLPKGIPPAPTRVTTTATTVSTSANRTFTSVMHNPPIIFKVTATDSCFECKQPMIQRYHLTTSLNCLRCRYVTCCLSAMEEHSKKFHTSQRHKLPFGRDIVLPKVMYCICGFKSNKGNVLANHLTECGKRSAYPNLNMLTQSASFPPLVTLDDGEGTPQDPNDQWMKAYVNPRGKDDEKATPAVAPASGAASGSMLDVLGLVRKASTDEDTPPAKKDKLDDASDEIDDVTEAAADGKEQKSATKDADDDDVIALEDDNNAAATAASAVADVETMDTSVTESINEEIDMEIKEEDLKPVETID